MDLDPNLWPELEEYKTITLTDDGEVFTIVDEETYSDLIQWKWHLYNWKGKQYAKRTKNKQDHWNTPKSIYMHRYLAGKYLWKPSNSHYIVDHKFSNGLDNRLSMLVWATPRQNRLNMYGMWWQQKDFIKDLEKNE